MELKNELLMQDVIISIIEITGDTGSSLFFLLTKARVKMQTTQL